MADDDDMITLKLPVGTIVRDRWLITKRLGEGGCGVVYEVHATSDIKRRLALKIEPIQKSKDDEILKMEVHVLKQLQGKSGHICEMVHCGKTDTYNFLVMTMLGTNLGDLRRTTPDQRFTMSTAMRMGRQSLAAIRDIHKVGFVHRDIKPANFALGRWDNDRRILYILDFGLSRGYWDVEKGTGKRQVRQPRTDVAFRGTLRYCSLNVHARKEQGRQDDLISWLYQLIEMVVGQLPWRHGDRRETQQMKSNINEKQLFGTRSPHEFKWMLKYLSPLKYADNPDYRRLDNWCKDVMTREKVDMHEAYDWEEGGAYYTSFLKKEKEDAKNDPAQDEKLTKDPGCKSVDKDQVDTMPSKTINGAESKPAIK